MNNHPSSIILKENRKIQVWFADLTHTGFGINANTFPLGIGLVAANVQAKVPGVEVKIFKFPETLNQTLHQQQPDVFCFSNYIWNTYLGHLYARYIHTIHPHIPIIAGGPNFPLTREDRQRFLENRPEIDFYIKGDGETALRELLDCLTDFNGDAKQLRSQKILLKNCCYLTQGHYIEGPDFREPDLNQNPSPYLSGVLDDFFQFPLTPLLETTRGCPYGCTFCNDGSPLRSRVTRKDQATIAAELDYIAPKTKLVAQLALSDLNFGMYKEDIQTSRLIKSILDRTGWPSRLNTSIGKSHPDRIFQAVNLINEKTPGVFKMGASFQSTDSEVLKETCRKNIPLEHYLSVPGFNSSNDTNEYFSELILCLPLDTKEKHYQSLRHVIDTLGMNNIDVHQLVLLQGTVMAQEQEKLRHGFNLAYRVFVGCIGLYPIGDTTLPAAEIEEIVIGHKTMPLADYLECRLLTLLVKTFIDHDPFVEIFHFVRFLGLSQLDLLLHIKDRFLPRFPTLKQWADRFIQSSTQWLFPSHEVARTFVSSPENVNKFLAGEYGLNEILHYRALAYLEHNLELHALLQEGVLSYLETFNLLDDDYVLYIREAIEYSKLRKCDFNQLNETRTARFQFDFTVAAQSNFKVDPKQIQIPETTFEFHHDAETLNYLRSMRETWNYQANNQIGKLFQKINLINLNRRVTIGV